MNVPQLAEIQQEVKRGGKPQVTVREFLRWFHAERRGRWIVQMIRSALKETDLATVPDFEFEYIDGPIYFVPRKAAVPTNNGLTAIAPPQATVATPDSSPTSVASLARQDPAYRVKKLEAANRAPVSVTPDKPIAEAVTIMLTHDFSQLPVMQGERKVLGLLSWKSLGSRLAIGSKCERAADAMDAVTMVTSDASIFQVADIIAKHEVVLVQASTTDPKITGILTSADLAVQFGELGEPFLLLGEIENQVRELLDGKFSPTELGEMRDPADMSRAIEDISDLTFGEYVRLLEKPERWDKCFKNLDRGVFIEQLKKVRDIRNDVMHFDPDGIGQEDIEQLRRFSQFLQRLSKLAAQSGVDNC